MQIKRRFTMDGQDVFANVRWDKRTSRITHTDGSVVFEMKDAEIPADWSQLATDIVVSKYFRKAGVPQLDEAGNPKLGADNKPILGPERSVRQVAHRMAGCWTHWGKEHGYFDTPEDAQAFYDELAYMLVHQIAAPNSPQWFNTGLAWAYGLSGPAQGHWTTNPSNGQLELCKDAYSHPQPHACFIQSVSDDLVNEGGIMDLWTREARLFKFGSGTGTNYSKVRGENEPLSGGGRSSGLMSFLRIGDRAAGAIKSGGTTRRAAKMVCLEMDHPDIEEFVNWKVREELKVAALVEGLKHLPKEQQALAGNLKLKLDYDFNGEAYATVSGQNSNNSVRVSNAFLAAVEAGSSWNLVRRGDGKIHRTIEARHLWDQVNFAAWRCADPGVQFDDTINDWHTCPQSGRINASNPCSEYMFLDNTACNLASINLMKLFDAQNRSFDIEGFKHACRLWTVVLEISVLMAAYPSREVARLSFDYRTLGLGYANIGTMLMVAGIPYDSDAGRAVCGAVTALMTGESYATSAEMAKELGSFPGYHRNRKDMLRVIRNHRAAAYNDVQAYDNLGIKPLGIDAGQFGAAHKPATTELLTSARESWDRALALGEQFGYRNAQVTVIAPTGTIGLVMDCDTTGVEPDFALVKFKKLSGGGYFKIANQSIEPALHNLGYSAAQIKDILTYVLGTLTLTGAPHINPASLTAKGFTAADLAVIEKQLVAVFELDNAFNGWALGEETMRRLGFEPAQWQHHGFNLLKHLGFSKRHIREANDTICGRQTIEGAPHIKDTDLAVFDCANRNGRSGKRFIHYLGHIHMMAAAQPFISGAISKTINMTNEVTVADIASAYQESWKVALKAVALYRDGSKLSQPLNSSADDDASDDEDIDALKAENVMACKACGDPSPAAHAVAESKAVVPTERIVERIVEKIVHKPLRRRLPDTRRSLTHKFDVAGHEGYITVGLFEDGSPGEVFITMAKQGSTVGGLMDSIATLISMSLQYGVPVDAMVRKFEHMRFEPAGMTANRDIPFAKSIVDYVARWLGMEFISGYRDANAPHREPDINSIESGQNLLTPILDKEAQQTDPSVTIAVAEAAANRARLQAGSSNGNGNGNGHATATATVTELTEAVLKRREQILAGPVAIGPAAAAKQKDTLSQQTSKLMGDAPTCTCGTIMVRNGTCYRCLNCGSSAGCS